MRTLHYTRVVDFLNSIDYTAEEVIAFYGDADSLIVTSRSLQSGIVTTVTYPMHDPQYVEGRK